MLSLTEAPVVGGRRWVRRVVLTGAFLGALVLLLTGLRWAVRDSNAPGSADVPYAVVASLQEEPRESWAQAADRTLGYGFDGLVRYLPLGERPRWDAQFRELAALHGTEPLRIQLTAKTHGDAGLADVLSHLPAAWKPGFVYNIYQEPEDDLREPAAAAAYRQAYADAAKITRRYGVQLPWVEWQEWTLDPANPNGWDLADFRPPAEDVGGVLWSLFEYGQVDRLDQQVERITAAMRHYYPGKPWALMAAGYELPADPGDAALRAQAAWLERSFSLTKAAGSSGWAWFNANTSAEVEFRVERNPRALRALRSLDRAPVPSAGST